MKTYHLTRLIVVLATVAIAAACTKRQALPRLQSKVLSAAQSLIPSQQVAHLDIQQAYEPMVVQHPGGDLFVSGAGEPFVSDSEYYARPSYWDSFRRDRLWKSHDNGATWSRVDLGPSAEGVIGNSDMDLAVAPDGTLYYVSMTWVETIGEGQQIAIGVSRDIGETWRWNVLSKHRYDDRPWVDVARDGTVHVVWNDGEGVQHVVSRDAGATWSQPALVYRHAGSSHLAVGPNGEVAVRLIPWAASHNFRNPAVDAIAVSTDAGVHWKLSPAPGQRNWGTWRVGAVHSRLDDGAEMFTGDRATRRSSGTGIPRWVEPLAWDGEGRLYALWAEPTGMWLAQSADRGTTWDKWQIVQSSARCYYPYVVAHGDGELAASWHCGEGDALRWQAAQITMGHGGAPPRVMVSSPLELDAFEPDGLRHDGVRRATAGEYLPPVFLRDGSFGVVTPMQGTVRNGFTWWRFESR